MNDRKIVNRMIETIKQNGVPRESLKKLIKKIIIFEPNEIEIKHKKIYELPNDVFYDVLENGGILLITNCNNFLC